MGNDLIAGELIAFLGKGKLYEVDENRVIIELENKHQFQTPSKGYTVIDQGSKWRVHGWWPSDLYGHTHSPSPTNLSINVSKHLGVENLAKEILRRFDPEYDRLHAEAMESVVEYNKDFNGRNEIRDFIAESFGLELSEHERQDIGVGINCLRNARVESGDRLSFTTKSMSLEDAKKVVEFFKTAFAVV